MKHIEKPLAAAYCLFLEIKSRSERLCVAKELRCFLAITTEIMYNDGYYKIGQYTGKIFYTIPIPKTTSNSLN